MLVADTDFLGALLKAESLAAVLETFDEEKIVIPQQVEEEIPEELEEKLGDSTETKQVEPIEESNLGKGERAAIALASEEDLLLMNDEVKDLER